MLLPAPFSLSGMRDVIDSEQRLLAAAWWSIREHGGEPTNRHVDEGSGSQTATQSGKPTVAKSIGTPDAGVNEPACALGRTSSGTHPSTTAAAYPTPSPTPAPRTNRTRPYTPKSQTDRFSPTQTA